MKKYLKSTLNFLVVFALSITIQAQNGYLEDRQIHAVSLEGNLVQEPTDRSVMVYLPPGYNQQPNQRFPVVYLLHGFNGNYGNKEWFARDSSFQVTRINQLIEDAVITPMIIVMPDGSNRFGGSFYTNSVATGNWEDVIVKDVVDFVDLNYRTIASREGRGIAGHSMGGYGAFKIAMKHPDVFIAVYGTSACCLNRSIDGFDSNTARVADSVKTWEGIGKLKFFPKVFLASSAAWSPNPDNPPFFVEIPTIRKGLGSDQAKAKWLANVPTWMIDQYRTNLHRLSAIAFDAGTNESHIQSGNRLFSEALKSNHIPHTFEVFEGGHNDKKKQRLETKILPFFSNEFEK